MLNDDQEITLRNHLECAKLEGERNQAIADLKAIMTVNAMALARVVELEAMEKAADETIDAMSATITKRDQAIAELVVGLKAANEHVQMCIINHYKPRPEYPEFYHRNRDLITKYGRPQRED